MITRKLLPVILVFAVTLGLTVGCSSKDSPPTDPESLQKAADEMNRIAKEENEKRKKEKKGKTDE